MLKLEPIYADGNRDREGSSTIQTLPLPYLENIGGNLQKLEALCADGEWDRGG
jgi:hypothetical protein